MNLIDLKNIVNQKKELSKVNKNIIKEKINILMHKRIFFIGFIEYCLNFTLAMFLISFIGIAFVDKITSASIIKENYTFTYFYILLPLFLSSHLFFKMFKNVSSFRGLVLYLLYKKTIKKLSKEIKEKVMVNGKYEDINHNKKDLIEIENYYQSLNEKQKEFFNSNYTSYEDYLSKSLSEFITDNKAEVVKKNKEFLSKVISENIHGHNYKKINNLIKEKFEEDTKNKEKEILNLFDNKKKIKNNVIEL